MKTVMTASLVAFVLVAACAKKDDTAQPTTPSTAAGAYSAQPYPAQPYPAQPYPAQQTYAPQGAPTPMTTTPMGTAPATAAPATGAMATPGPLALPCQNDTSCGLAHCNVQYSKCAFPCVGPADCITGAACNTATGLCLPAAK